MNNKRYILIISAAVVLIFVGIVVFSKYKGPGEPQALPQTPSASEDSAKRQEELLNVSREAIFAGDAEKCAGLASADERVACQAYVITAQAQENNDAAICNKITAEYWRTNCKDQLTTRRAVLEKNPDLCNTLLVEARIPACKQQAAGQGQ